MVSSTRQAIAGFFVIFGVAVLVHAQTTSVKELTSTVSGRITIKDKPAPGIAIGLRMHDQSRPQPVSHRAVTDLNGEYRITNVPAGTFLVSISAPAFVLADESLSERTLIISKGETIEHVDFTLLRGGVITGKVSDSDGRPLIQQTVSIIPENQQGRGYYRQVNTDDRGIYRAFGIPAGAYRVAAGTDEEDSFGGRFQGAFYRRTYYPNVSDTAQAKVIQVSEGSEATNVDIVLSRTVATYTASGRIVDEAGQPVPNIPYGVTHFINANSTHSLNTGQVSNARGEFKLDKLMPGSYAAMISRMDADSDLRSDQVRFEITDQDVTGLVITIKKASSVSGVIVVEGGNDDKALRDQLTKTGISVSVSGPSLERGGFGHFTNPAADGSFRIGGLSPGTATFYLMSSSRFRVVRVERDGVVQPRGVEIKERENVTGLRIIASYANASVRGMVELQNGTLPPNAQFSVWLTKLGEEPGTTNFASTTSQQVDARGQFVIEGLMPGEYELHAGLYVPGVSGDMPFTKQTIVVTAGVVTNVTVTLDLSPLTKRP